MTDLMTCLFDYYQNERLYNDLLRTTGYQCYQHRAIEQEHQLREMLSEQGIACLEALQDAQCASAMLELKAYFQFGFSAATELFHLPSV